MLRYWIAGLIIAVFWIGPSKVANSQVPLQADADLERPHAWRAQEIWRAGHEDDDVIFGVITGIAADDDGRTHVLDGQLSIIHAFGPEGDHLDAQSHEGEGPGETRQPNDICLIEPDRLAVAHGFPGRVVTLDLNGVPAGDIHYSPADDAGCGYMVLRWLRATEELLVLGGFCMGLGDKSGKDGNVQVDFISRCTPGGRELGRYLERHRPVDHSGRVIDEMDFDEIWSRAALGGDGRLYVAPDRNAYLVQIFRPDGSMQCEIQREMDGLPRTPERLSAVKRDLRAWSRYYKSPPHEIKCFSSEPCITGLWPRPEGELWVRTSRGDDPVTTGAAIVLDVFDASGRFKYQTSIECPFDPDRDVLRPLGSDRLLVIQGGREAALDLKGGTRPNDHDGPLTLICFRLRKAS